MRERIRVLMAKPGLDGHDRGIGVIARALRDAGMEVIYLGLHQTPDDIVRAAIEEHARVIAISVLSGGHVAQFRKIMNLLFASDMTNVLVTGGGIIPDADKKKLHAMGVGRLFDPGTATQEIVDYIQAWWAEHQFEEVLPKDLGAQRRKSPRAATKKRK